MFIQINGRDMRVAVVRTFPVRTKSPVVRMMRSATVMQTVTYRDAGKNPYTKEVPKNVIFTQPIELGREWRINTTPYFVVKPYTWLARDNRRTPTWTLTPKELIEGILRYAGFAEKLIQTIDWAKAKIQKLIYKLIALWRDGKFHAFHLQCKELFS